jgi:hypothetical protein
LKAALGSGLAGRPQEVGAQQSRQTLIQLAENFV